MYRETTRSGRACKSSAFRSVTTPFLRCIFLPRPSSNNVPFFVSLYASCFRSVYRAILTNVVESFTSYGPKLNINVRAFISVIPSGPLWSTNNNGPLWSTLIHSGPLWSTLVHSGPRWSTMVHYGPLWSTNIKIMQTVDVAMV